MILVVHLTFEPVLETTIFYEVNEEPLDESSSTPADGATELGLDIEEDEDGGQDSGSDANYDMEEDY